GQSNGAGQSQTADSSSNGCCSKDHSGETSQEASQSNSGSNSADQTATSSPTVINASPNVAVGNGGDVHHSSGSTENAPVTNNATQANGQSNGAGQSQTAAGDSSSGCCGKGHSGETSQEADQSNKGSNSADQTATSAPVIINSSPNVAVANGAG